MAVHTPYPVLHTPYSLRGEESMTADPENSVSKDQTMDDVRRIIPMLARQPQHHRSPES